MKSLAIGRIVGLIFTVVFVVTSVWSGVEAKRLNDEFYDWIDARPLEAEVDLSQPGIMTTPFHQTCGSSHGEALYLECDLNFASEEEVTNTFAGLSGLISIEDATGTVIESIELDPETISFRNDMIVLNGFAPFPKGEYVAHIDVESGATALSGVRQLMYAQYLLCGLELLPSKIYGAVAIGLGLVGLFFVFYILPAVARHGIWKSELSNIK